MLYSRELAKRYQKTMLEEYDYVVTDEQAELDLDSLTRLLFSFSNIESINDKVD